MLYIWVKSDFGLVCVELVDFVLLLEIGELWVTRIEAHQSNIYHVFERPGQLVEGLVLFGPRVDISGESREIDKESLLIIQNLILECVWTNLDMILDFLSLLVRLFTLGLLSLLHNIVKLFLCSLTGEGPQEVGDI